MLLKGFVFRPASKPNPRNPWAWIPTLYFAQGLPNVLIASVLVICYKNLGVADARAAFYTSLLYLPWVIKPLWSPFVEELRTRRAWIWGMQLVGSAGLACVALAMFSPFFLPLTVALFALIAFGSASHDIAADGFYMLANTEHNQAFFSGVRTVAFNLAKITLLGLLVTLAGVIHQCTGSFTNAWFVTFAASAAMMAGLAVYHHWILPRPTSDVSGTADSAAELYKEFAGAFGDYFRKPKIMLLLAFLLLYRFGEAQLTKIGPLFLIGARAQGGLGLTDTDLSVAYGIGGTLALIAGGLLGGFVIARQGLKFWLWPMVLAIHLPDTVFVLLAYAQPTDLQVIRLGVAVEMFGYGFGFAAYLLYMIHIARGKHQTAHYAICTGFMALGLMVPQMWSGWLADQLGYRHFFVWVLLATIPGFLVTALIPLDKEFGRRKA